MQLMGLHGSFGDTTASDIMTFFNNNNIHTLSYSCSTKVGFDIKSNDPNTTATTEKKVQLSNMIAVFSTYHNSYSTLTE